jgi:hypothetical protein
MAQNIISLTQSILRTSNSEMWKVLINFILKLIRSNFFKLKKTRRAGHVAGIEKKRNAYTIFVGIPHGKKPLGRSL